MFSAGQIGGALGPPVVGVFGDSEVGFPGALVAMAILLVVMMAVLFRNDRRHTVAEPLTLRGTDGL